MVELIKAVNARLDGDTELNNLAQELSFRRNPEKPKEVATPLVAIQWIGAPDEIDYHGAKINPELEFHIWGYGDGEAKDAWRIAQRLDELLLTGFSISDGSEASKFRAVTGWNDTQEPDPDTVHLFNRYAANYWSVTRIQALGAQ